MKRTDPVRIALAAEDHAGVALVCGWTDRLLREHAPGWFRDMLDANPSALDDQRAFVAPPSAEGNYYKLGNHRDAPARGHRGHGHFGKKPGGPDAALVRFVLLDCARAEPAPDVVTIARDLDGLPARRAGAQQAIDEKPWPFTIILAWAQPEAEAWALSVYRPGDEAARLRLEALRRALGFDPTLQPDRLSSASKSPKDTKRVFRELTERERVDVDLDVHAVADLDDKFPSPETSGLREFLTAVREHIVPRVWR